jgi:hypothetical protein
VPRRSDVGTRFAIEIWTHRYSTHDWAETGFQDIETQQQAEQEAADRFHPNDLRTRVVEYVTTSRVVSTSEPTAVQP